MNLPKLAAKTATPSRPIAVISRQTRKRYDFLPSDTPDAMVRLVDKFFKLLAPPPKLTVSEWADKYRMLSPDVASEAGRWHTDRAEYLRGIMDAMNDPTVPRVVIAKASQVGYSEALCNALGFFIDQDPSLVLFIQPTLELAEAFSKERIAPLIRDTPSLLAKVTDAKARIADNTIRQKTYPGGRLSIIGANSPASLASRPIRVVLADEVDRYPSSAGSEGDPLALAAKRQQTFWNRKTILGSTPVLMATSVVWREWLKSDMRRFHVPCPDCGTYQHLKWSNVRWDKGPDGEHQWKSAHYVCEDCGSVWTDVDRWDAVKRGKWIAERPFEGMAGFHVPGMLSSWLLLSEIVKEFLDARRDPFLLQVWTNTVLGEPWEDATERVDGSTLINRRENYGPDSLPNAVAFLTAGVDVQANRLELQVVGWGDREESWAVDYEVILGDPAQPDTWKELDALLIAPYKTENGRVLRIKSCCVDTGGHHSNQVLQFCRRRRARRVWPIKGASGARAIWPKQASRTKTNFFIYVIGVDTAKDAVYGRLRIDKQGPGHVHFPISDAFSEEYFAQLTSEVIETRKKEGKSYRVWTLPEGRRNEALDTFVYALAARMSTPIRLDVSRVLPNSAPTAPDEGDFDDAVDPDVGTPARPPPREPYRQRQPWIAPRQGWFNRW